MVKPWKPPSLFRSAGDVEIWNAILLWAGQSIALDQDTKCRFAVTDAPSRDLRGHHLRFGQHIDLIVAPLQFPFKQMFDADFDVDELERLPPSVAARLDQAVVDTMWAAVPDARIPTPVIKATGPVGDLVAGVGVKDLEDLRWFIVDIEGSAGGAGVSRVEIGLRIDDMLHFTAGGTIAPRIVPTTLAMQITSPVSRLAGSIALSRPDVGRLRAGDVIALADDAGSIIKLCGQGRAWVFRRRGEGYEIIWTGPAAPHAGGMETEPMTDDPTTDALMLLVQFEIGRLDVPLGALDAWRTGTVVSFEPPQLAEGALVTMRVNGHEIGSGDLIRVDDRLAVRITHLMGSPSP